MIEFIRKSTIYILILFFFIGSMLLYWTLFSTATSLNRKISLKDAELYSKALSEFRILYTTEVVNRLKDSEIEITHNYKDVEHAIPLPATMGMMFGKRMSDDSIGGGASFLYSPYPFPWRESNGGLKDDFAKDAWEFLNKNPDEAFYAFEDTDDGVQLRYATADIMKESCVNCHNTHPDTPKNDWKANDVRGVLEVRRPVAKVTSTIRLELLLSGLIYFFILGGGIVIIALIIRKLQNKAFELNEQIKVTNIQNEEKELLLREIHHRVKNNLQIIVALLGLQSMSLNDEEAKKLFAIAQNRINSIALVHELLYSTENLSEINAYLYIDKLVRTVINPIENKVLLHLNTNDVKLNIDTSVSLGIIINELATNAVKHAFSGVENPQINIELNKVEEGQYVLSFSDNGVGNTSSEKGSEPSSIGMSIIKSLVRQLKGELKMEIENGTHYQIYFREIDKTSK